MFDEPQLPPLPAGEGKPHIYVMNSDEAFLEMIADLLSDTRAHVTLEQLRPNVEVSLENLRLARPDLLILDVVPGQKSSAILLDRMERDSELRRLPVIVASTTGRIAEELANEHADIVRDVLPKPFELDAFYRLLNRLVVGIVTR